MPGVVRCGECERETFAGQTRCPHCGKLLPQPSSGAGVRSSGGHGNVRGGGFDDNIKSLLIGFFSGVFAVLPISITNNMTNDNPIPAIILLSSYLIFSGIICGIYCKHLVLSSLGFIFIYSLIFVNIISKDNTEAHFIFVIIFAIVPILIASSVIFLLGVLLGRQFDFGWMKKNSGS